MTTTVEVPLSDILEAAGWSALGDEPSPEAIEAALRTLVSRMDGSDPLRRETAKSQATQRLKDAGLPGASRLVQAAFASAKQDNPGKLQGRALDLDTPDPWPEEIDGAGLLDEVVRTFARFLALPDGSAIALALWVLHAHAHDAANISPILALTSPEKQCGKTTTLSVLGALVPRPLFASNVSSAAVFRTVEMYTPTLLVDEADTFLDQNEALRGILNSGHSRAAAFTVRVSGEEYEPRRFSTWGPKALARIGTLHPTLEDRSIVVRLRRRAADEAVEPLRLDRLNRELEPLRRKAVRWAADHLDTLRQADPDVPAGFRDRTADNWRPLLAIADAAGGIWPERARRAAALLGGTTDEGEDAGPMLLADLRKLFEHRQVDRLPSEEIVRELGRLEHRPWPEWKQGKPLSVQQLAKVLGRYGVRPHQIRFSPTDNRKGYHRKDFADAFRRYLPPAGAETSKQSSNSGRNSVCAPETPSEAVSDVKHERSAENLGCFPVPVPMGQPEPEVFEL